MLHAKPACFARLHHPIVSHNLNKGLAHECAWIATRDYSAMLSALAGLDFFRQIGGAAVMAANHAKVTAAAAILSTAWETPLPVPPSMCGSMAMVQLPPALRISNEDEALALRCILRDRYAVEVRTRA